jgi:hypothetical protein
MSIMTMLSRLEKKLASSAIEPKIPKSIPSP